MSCIKNPKKFLWISYNGDHDWRIEYISKFMEGVSDDFHTRERCILCGLKKNRQFVEAEELIERGIPIEDLNNRDYNRSLF